MEWFSGRRMGKHWISWEGAGFFRLPELHLKVFDLNHWPVKAASTWRGQELQMELLVDCSSSVLQALALCLVAHKPGMADRVWLPS